MNKQDLWQTFWRAVQDGQEGEVRKTYEALYRSASKELLPYAVWCVRQHSPNLIPAHMLIAREVIADALTQLYLARNRINTDPRLYVIKVIHDSLFYGASRAVKENRNAYDAQRALNALRRRIKIRCSLAPHLRRKIRKAVLQLPKRMKLVIIYLFYCNESIGTTAKKMKIASNTVVVTKNRALKRLEGLISD